MTIRFYGLVDGLASCMKAKLIALFSVFAFSVLSDSGKIENVQIDLMRKPQTVVLSGATSGFDYSLRASILSDGSDFDTDSWRGLFVLSDGTAALTVTNTASDYGRMDWRVDASLLPTNGTYTAQIIGISADASEEWARGKITVRGNPSSGLLPAQWITNSPLMGLILEACNSELAIATNATLTSAKTYANSKDVDFSVDANSYTIKATEFYDVEASTNTYRISTNEYGQIMLMADSPDQISNGYILNAEITDPLCDLIITGETFSISYDGGTCSKINNNKITSASGGVAIVEMDYSGVSKFKQLSFSDIKRTSSSITYLADRENTTRKTCNDYMLERLAWRDANRNGVVTNDHCGTIRYGIDYAGNSTNSIRETWFPRRGWTARGFGKYAMNGAAIGRHTVVFAKHWGQNLVGQKFVTVDLTGTPHECTITNMDVNFDSWLKTRVDSGIYPKLGNKLLYDCDVLICNTREAFPLDCIAGIITNFTNVRGATLFSVDQHFCLNVQSAFLSGQVYSPNDYSRLYNFRSDLLKYCNPTSNWHNVHLYDSGCPVFIPIDSQGNTALYTLYFTVQGGSSYTMLGGALVDYLKETTGATDDDFKLINYTE